MKRLALLAWLVGCSTPEPVEEGPPPEGVVFTYPADQQRDVPLGARVLVSFAQSIAETSPGCQVFGPAGEVAIETALVGDGKTVAITAPFEPGTTYEVLVAGARLIGFTTRSDQPRSGPPALVAVNGSDPAAPGTFRPIFESSTLQLVFSEPLDPRTLALEPDALELVDVAGTPVPATLLATGIHASIDPHEPLVAGAAYELRLGGNIRDLGGEAFAPVAIPLAPVDSLGRGPIRQTFRTRVAGDPNADVARTDAVNAMVVEHPLIGTLAANMHPATLETELGDPAVLGGPIAFRIPKGQRLSGEGLDILLANAVPSGLTTGDVRIELLADGGGRMYRNPFQPDGPPDNAGSPVQVDLSFDLAVHAGDPTGNAALSQTILGVQLTGLAIADHGSLAIETLGAIDINLVGITSAPTNIVLDLVSDPGAAVAIDAEPPVLLATLPAADSRELATDDGIELLFDEPIDLARGGISLRDAGGNAVPSTFELHGSVVVIRPRATLQPDHAYTVELLGAADLTGNAMEPATLAIATAAAPADGPPTVVSVYPGAPCSLVDASAASAGRCAGGGLTDDPYRPFSLAANERLSLVFDRALAASSLALGTACDTGSVRVERLDATGGCADVVPGTLVRRQRDFEFVPDRPWTPGERYRLRVISGANATCDPGEVCGTNGRPASFDPLAGLATAGGPDLAITFLAMDPTTATTMLVNARPDADNRAALRIAGTSGLITSATFESADCVPETPEVEACMYMLGAIPAQLGERRDNCTLPDGTMVASCIPVAMSAQAMYSTSVTMRAAALGIPLTTSTGTSVMRIREPADRALEGYIIERDGGPVMVAALALYLDAPEMSLPIAQHDMHSKPLEVALEGPLVFLPDGRIAITLSNREDMPITVGISAPLGISGSVSLVAPAGEMKLQLVSAAQRGSLP